MAELPARLLDELRAHVEPSRVLSDPADRAVYSYDNSRRSVLPAAVVLATSAADVLACVTLCRDRRVPLVTRGRGTNTTGATVPVAGGIVLSLERMNRILRVVPGDRLLECEAGATNAEVQRAAAPHGLFWAPDPTSAEYSSVGGNLACNAGGPRAVKYGAARDNVLGLRAISGGAQELRTGAATTKGAVGYDLTRLLVGSEGTLAVITQALLKLLPWPPERRTLQAAFDSVEAAAGAVAAIMAQPHVPCALEFMDQSAVRLAQAYDDVGLSDAVGALLILEVDGDAQLVEAAAIAVSSVLRAQPGLVDLRVAASAADAQRLWRARKALSPALRRLAPLKVNEDVVVPVTRIPALVRGLQAISDEHGIRIVNFGHAGNGNLHVNLLLDPADPAQAKALEPCLGAVFRLVLDLDGSLSGEHGVGLAKRPYVEWEIDAPTLAVMRGIKHLLDPAGILNPGKALPGI